MATPTPTPTPTPQAALTPFQQYQLALQKYAPQFATPTPIPSAVYGSPAPSGASPMPAAPISPTGPGLGALIGLKLATSGGTAAVPAATGLGSALGAGVAGSTGTLAQAGAGLGLKGASLGGTTTLAPAATGGLGALPIAGIGIGALLAGKAGYDMFKGKTPNLPGRILLGVGTGGLSEIAKATGLFGHKSTKDRQKERWNSLLEEGRAPEWAFANGVNQDQGFGDRDLRDPNFDPRKVWASSAMFDTFGKDWATTGTADQRAEITKQILANKLIDTKQGVSYMLDKDKANQIKTNVLANLLAAPAVKPVIIPRSTTLSPGIGKDGKRINYGAKK